MSDELEPTEFLEDGDDVFERHQNDLMDMFDELSFREKWKRVSAGLKMPPNTGPHKWAKLQMLRLLSPVAAVIVPILLLGMISIFAKFGPEPTRSVEVKVVEPEAMEELEEIEEPIIEPIEPPEPVDIEFVTPDTDLAPSEVAAPPQDTTVQQAEFDSVAMVKSPMIMKGIYGSRSPGSRGAALDRYGGSGTEGAVLRALRHLKKTQQSDGSWGKTKPAITSLGLLAFLAHGDTPASPEFGYTVESAIRYLVAAQEPSGRFKGRDNHDYTHPIAAYALAEAYAVTKIPSLKGATIKAVNVIIKGQNPSGSFNYNLKPTTRNDTSYAAWCVQALKAAKMAGLYGDIPGLKKCMTKCIAGLNVNYGERDGYGGFGYASKGGSHGTGLTGAAVLCLQFLGASNTPECKGGLNGLSKWDFNWEKPRKGSFLYYMYYTTQAKFQQGGSSWDAWNRQFSPSLMQHQKIVQADASGYVDHNGVARATGTWISPAAREHNGSNPVMDTILCTLMLEVYYRYLPTFMAVPEDAHEEEGIGEDDDDLDIDFGFYEPDSDRIMRKHIVRSTSGDLAIDLI